MIYVQVTIRIQGLRSVQITKYLSFIFIFIKGHIRKDTVNLLIRQLTNEEQNAIHHLSLAAKLSSHSYGGQKAGSLKTSKKTIIQKPHLMTTR